MEDQVQKTWREQDLAFRENAIERIDARFHQLLHTLQEIRETQLAAINEMSVSRESQTLTLHSGDRLELAQLLIRNGWATEETFAQIFGKTLSVVEGHPESCRVQLGKQSREALEAIFDVPAGEERINGRPVTKQEMVNLRKHISNAEGEWFVSYTPELGKCFYTMDPQPEDRTSSDPHAKSDPFHVDFGSENLSELLEGADDDSASQGT